MDELWARAAHMQAGYKGLRYRWVQLYLNGLYWGMYQMTERFDEDFLTLQQDKLSGGWDALLLSSYTDTCEVESGDLAKMDQLKAACDSIETAVLSGNTAAADAARVSSVLPLLDVGNYVDYLITRAFCMDTDWPHNNGRAGAKRVATSFQPDGSVPPSQDGRFKFYQWDCEFSFFHNTTPAHWMEGTADRWSGMIRAIIYP